MLLQRRFEIKLLFLFTCTTETHKEVLIFLAEQFAVGSSATLPLTSTSVVMPQIAFRNRDLSRMARRCRRTRRP